MQSRAAGHIAGTFTGIVWGLTFLSTKVLLDSFAPFQILFLRFLIAFLVLCAVCPHILRLREGHPSDELLFAACGLTGVVAYFSMENSALLFTEASHVSVVTATAPLFIAIIATILGRERALKPAFIVGFVLAITGIALISLSGTENGGFRFGFGEVLAMVGAVMWGIYSNILVSITNRGYETIATVKRIFAWGLIFMVVLMPFMGLTWDFSRLLELRNAGNLLFLGLVASGVCYITWSFTVERLGASQAGGYIYMQPAVTIIAAMLFLDEGFTWRIGVGLVLVLEGLLLSEGRFEGKAKARKQAKAPVEEPAKEAAAGEKPVSDAVADAELASDAAGEGFAHDEAPDEGERR